MFLILKIKIAGVADPPVWRRIAIHDGNTFEDLHYAIQNSFGWVDYHLYEFVPRSGHAWSITDARTIQDRELFYRIDNELLVDASACRLSHLLKEGIRIKYIYDFGDYWVHDITVEEAVGEGTPEAKGLHKRGYDLLDAKGACPPEDVGGASGYREMKRLFAEDPQGGETMDYATWLGLAKVSDFDPADTGWTNLKRFGIEEIGE